MGYASYNEDIGERQDENTPNHRVYGLLDSRDPTEYLTVSDPVICDINIFRRRIELYALNKTALDGGPSKIQTLHARNDRLRKECEEKRELMNSENAEFLEEQIDYREKLIAETLQNIVDLTLSPSQKSLAALFERRLIDRCSRKSNCYACKRDLFEGPHTFCIDCGGIKCSCGDCFCNYGEVLKPSL